MATAPAAEPARGQRNALLIAGRTEDPSPATIERLAAALGDPDIGGWTVSTLVDAGATDVHRAVLALFDGARPGSSVLLYWASDVVATPEGALYLAVADTDPALLAGSAVPAVVIPNGVNRTAASEIVIVFDGAGSGSLSTQTGEQQLRAPTEFQAPTVVITSGPPGSARSSEFTSAFVDGVASGAADADGDGYVSIDELYDYILQRTRTTKDDPTPQRFSAGVQEPILIARAGPGAPTPPRLEVSPSVRALHEHTADETAFALADRLLADHADYGKGRDRPELEYPPDAVTRPVDDWLADVRAVYRPDAVPVLHGRLVICGLALLVEGLREQLSRDGFLRAVEAELREPMLQLLLPAWRPAWQRPDSVPTLSDRPALVDQLGRKVFAEALATRIQDEHDDSVRRRGAETNGAQAPRFRGAPKADAFLVHLQGAWGSGKTSLLNLLADELRGSPARWIVVSFNAWQSERIGPPWWGLMQAVLREGVRDPFPQGWWKSADWWRQLYRGGARDILRSAKLTVLDFAWRVRLGWMAYLLLPALGALVWYGADRGWLDPDVRKVSDLKDAATAAAAIVTVLVTVVGAVRGLSRSLSVSSARGAQAFLASTRDPMRILKRRFRRLIGSLRRPVAIFIDDLDRCQASYVVEVLQGIQTLLLDEPVTYVVAADRQWLYDSYAKVYSDFAATVQEPGRPLGHLFLEKTFQLTAPLPSLPPDVRATFWHRLILVGADQAAGELEGLEAQAVERLEAAGSETEIREVVERSRHSSPEAKMAIRSAAIRRLAAPELRRRTEHTLKPFSHLLDPNPRAMKRLVNAYGVERDIRLLEDRAGSPDAMAPERLALWIILRLRWPLLAVYLADHPEAVEDDAAQNAADPALAALLDSADVKAVIQGRGVGVALTRDVIQELG
jgi:KAP family P-loop domain